MSKRTTATVAAILTALVMTVIVLVSLTACQPGTTGLARPLSTGAETSISNALVTINTTAPAVVPAPWGSVLEGFGAAALALLTAWQTWTHSRVNTLVANGKAATTDTKI